MTPEYARDGESRSGVTPGMSGCARPGPCPTRRGVLLGVGLAAPAMMLGGALAGCSTAAVPYGANEAGAVPGGQGPMATSGAMSGPGGGMAASPSPAHSASGGSGQDGSGQDGAAK
jgi:hypothetical protein